MLHKRWPLLDTAKGKRGERGGGERGKGGLSWSQNRLKMLTRNQSAR